MPTVIRYLLILVVAVVGLIAPTFVIPGPVDRGSLMHSISGSWKTASADSCRRTDATWRCWVTDGPSSSRNRYEVIVDGSCWEGRRIGRPASDWSPLPETLKGCIKLSDLLRPITRLLPQ